MTMTQLSKVNLGIVTSFNNIKEKAKNALSNLTSESTSEGEELVVQVYENERFTRINGWSSNNLLVDDCKRYVCCSGEFNEFPTPPLSQGYEFFGEWIIDYGVENSRNGWIYAASFEDMDNNAIDVLTDSNNLSTSSVRRRRWIRTVKESTGDDINYTNRETNELDVGADVEFTVDSDEERHTEESDSFTATSNPSLSGANNQNIESDVFSLFNFAKKNGSYDTDTTPFFLHDSGLIAIGKQISLIEAFCKKDEEHAEQEWKKTEKPQLESQIKELEKSCANLNSRIEKEIRIGLEHINALERDVKAHQEVLESVKKRFYFPNSSIVVGQGGVYAGLDDVWLEHASGHFEIELVPCKDKPQIKVVLTSGNISEGEKGVSIRLKAEGFKLAGDKGKGIPKLSMSSIKLTLVLVANILIDYDHKLSKWVTNSKNFSIKLVSFKGPYGTSKSIMGAILSIITPTLRTQMLKNLPHELGQLLRTLPSPFCIRGDFHVSGIELNLISAPFASTPAVLRLVNISRNQVHLFKYLQKSMDRPATSILNSISDILAYYRISKRHSRHWETIFVLWQQAAKIYSTKLIDAAYSLIDEMHSNVDISELNVDFETFISACKLINRKKLRTIFKLQHMDGQASVNQMLRHANQFLHRVATESVATASAAQKARMLMTLERIQTNYLYGLDAIKIISKNIDFAHVKIAAALHAGPNGVLEINVSDVFAQAPVMLDVNIQKDKQVGHTSLIPFIVSLKPQESGTVFIEVDQVIPGSQMKDDTPKEVNNLLSPSNPRLYSPLNPSQMSLKQLVSVVLTSPHISMIVDNASTFKPGTELFTLKVGPKDKGWMPFGHDTVETVINKSLSTREEQVKVDDERSKSPALMAMGCPVFIQTAPHIKFLAQIPSAEVNINLHNLTKFLISHFTDIAALKSYLELLFGGEFFEEQLVVGQIVLDRISKYILNPGLDLEVNIDGKIVALANEIMVRLETPQYIVNLIEGLYDAPNHNKYVFHNHFTHKPNEKVAANNSVPYLGSIPCVLELKAELNLMDLLDDSLAIESSIKSAIESSLKKVEIDKVGIKTTF